MTTEDTPKKTSSRANPEKEAFIAAVRDHLVQHGAKHWNLVLDRFPELKEATKWRYIREAKGETRPTDISDAREKLVAHVKKFPETNRGSRLAKKLAPQVREEIVDSLPAAPSPAYIAQNGDEGLRTIDFVAEIQSLYSDAKMLRTYAMKTRTNPETGEQTEVINNPAAFDKSILRRANLLETAIRAVQEVWDLRMMQNFYETIITEIGLESPECQQRIMTRLAALNQRNGMTLHSMRL